MENFLLHFISESSEKLTELGYSLILSKQHNYWLKGVLIVTIFLPFFRSITKKALKSNIMKQSRIGLHSHPGNKPKYKTRKPQQAIKMNIAPENTNITMITPLDTYITNWSSERLGWMRLIATGVPRQQVFRISPKDPYQHQLPLHWWKLDI